MIMEKWRFWREETKGKTEKSLYVGISSPSIGLQAARPDFMRWRYPFVVEWINKALILNILNRKFFICRDFLSLYRSTGGAPRLLEVTISICSWMNKYSLNSKHLKPEKSIYVGISSRSNGLQAARPEFLLKSVWARSTTHCKDCA